MKTSSLLECVEKLNKTLSRLAYTRYRLTAYSQKAAVSKELREAKLDSYRARIKAYESTVAVLEVELKQFKEK